MNFNKKVTISILFGIVLVIAIISAFVLHQFANKTKEVNTENINVEQEATNISKENSQKELLSLENKEENNIEYQIQENSNNDVIISKDEQNIIEEKVREENTKTENLNQANKEISNKVENDITTVHSDVSVTVKEENKKSNIKTSNNVIVNTKKEQESKVSEDKTKEEKNDKIQSEKKTEVVENNKIQSEEIKKEEKSKNNLTTDKKEEKNNNTNKERAFKTAYVKENTSIENEVISKIKGFGDNSSVTRGSASIKSKCSYCSQVSDAVSYAKSLGIKANWKVYVEEEYRYDSKGETAQFYERRIYVDFTL